MSPILMLVADRSPLFTTTVVVSGILIVVGVLFLLIGVFQLFGIIVPKINQKTTEMEEKSAARKAARKAKKAAKLAEKNGEAEAVAVEKPVTQAEQPTVPQPVIEQGISGEVVAAITAAIVASEGTGVTVRSIKKKKVSGRNPWAQAANIDNTRPF